MNTTTASSGSQSGGPTPERACPVSPDLFERYRHRHGVVLRNELTCAYVPLVKRIARRYARVGVTVEDLVQTGTIGLMKAVDAFDLRRGVAFETYATHFIAGEIRHYLRDGVKQIRRPRWAQKLHGEMTAACEQLQQELGRTPTIPEIAARMNVTEAGVLEIMTAYNYGLTVPLAELPEAVSIRRDFVMHQRFETLRLPIEDRIVLLEALDRLAELQRKVVYYLFFMDLTQTEAARRLGVSQRHVSRVLAAALKRLRTLLGNETDRPPIAVGTSFARGEVDGNG